MKLNFYTVYLILVVQWFLCLVGIWFLGNIVADIKVGSIVYPSPYYFLFESVKFSISIEGCINIHFIFFIPSLRNTS